jgi:ATP-dependent DNA ligase
MPMTDLYLFHATQRLRVGSVAQGNPSQHTLGRLGVVLALPSTLEPIMECAPVDALPSGPGWLYEWDGFRCLAFRDGQDVELRSRNSKLLARYFPEVAATLAGYQQSGLSSTAN